MKIDGWEDVFLSFWIPLPIFRDELAVSFRECNPTYLRDKQLTILFLKAFLKWDTSRKINMEPDNTPLEEEHDLNISEPNHHFQRRFVHLRGSLIFF